MAIIREAQSLKEANQHAVVLDFGDIAARGKQLREIAVREANTLLIQAHAEREKLLSTATGQGHAAGFKDGYAKGHAQGMVAGRTSALAQGAEDIAQLERTLTTGLDQFNSAREALLEQARADVIMIAVEIASRITARTFDSAPQTVRALLESALPMVLKPSRLRIHVHPDDAECITQTFPGLLQRFAMIQHIEVVALPDVPRGTCRVLNDRGGVIDASVATQLDRIAAELCYDRAAGQLGVTLAPPSTQSGGVP